MLKIKLFKPLSVVVLTLSVYMVTTPALAQRTGDSARVTVGTVESAAPVQLQSNSGRNALIGGAVGWALARNKSSGTQAAAALGGAALGGGLGVRRAEDLCDARPTVFYPQADIFSSPRPG